jgi:hypothetical protein
MGGASGAGSGGAASGAGGAQTGGQSGVGGGGTSGGGSGGNAGTSFTSAGADNEAGMGGAGAGGAAEAGASGQAGAGGESSAPFAGHCGEGWAADGDASSPELAGSVTPQVDKSGNWSFVFGRYRLVVAASRGARIVEFSIDGINLVDPSGGSTFWPSPQQAYTWPPPAELDTNAYTAQADATSLTLTSAVAKSLGLRVQKRFSVSAASGVVSIEYQLENTATKAASWAPWEVTRVRAGGYTFAPRGPGSRTITQDSFQHPLPLSLLPEPSAPDGIEWLNYPSVTASLTQDNYIAEFDGAEGWLAHANRLGKNSTPLLFVKSFADADDAALPDNQAEIQLWTSGTANPKLIEVEEQGEEQDLMPGDALTWTVHWSACELDASVSLAAGSAQLVALARAHAVAAK